MSWNWKVKMEIPVQELERGMGGVPPWRDQTDPTWNVFSGYAPKIVIIEIDSSIPPGVHQIHDGYDAIVVELHVDAGARPAQGVPTRVSYRQHDLRALGSAATPGADHDCG